MLSYIALASAAQAADVSAWSQIAPYDLWYRCLFWDAQRDRLLLGPSDVTPCKRPLVMTLSDPPRWHELPDAPLDPGRTFEFGTVLDARRDQLIAYDDYHNVVWALPLAEGSAWRKLNVSGSLPLPRRWSTLVLDEPRDRLIFYGGLGYGGNLRPEVWALPLQEPTAWVQLDLPPGGPAPRLAHCAEYDPIGDRMIVFGGSLAWGWPDTLSDETWALELSGDPVWAELTPAASPSARKFPSLVCDRRSRRMLLFGGASEAGKQADVWSLSLDSGEWSRLEVSGAQPSARFAHGAAMDTLRHRMLVFGGSLGANETWALALDGTPAWRKLSTLGAMPARASHALVADARQGRLLMIGGRDSVSAHCDVWQMRVREGGIWLTLPISGDSPPPRWNHIAVLDSSRNRVIVHGGRGASGLLGDLWALDLGNVPSWHEIAAPGDAPSPRESHAAAIDPARDALLIFGGADPDLRDDLFRLSLSGPPQWSRVAPAGGPPAPRRDHTLLLDSPQDRLILFGGSGAGGALDDLWRLDLAGATQWTPLIPGGDDPGPRSGHTAVYDGLRERMVIFGGDNGSVRTRSVYALELSGATPDAVIWRNLFARGAVPARSEHAACQSPTGSDRFYACGGANTAPYADVWAMDYAIPTPVIFAEVRVAREPLGARLSWRLETGGGSIGLHVHRQAPDRGRVRLTARPISAQGEGSFLDTDAPSGSADYWIEELGTGESMWHGPYPLGAAPLPAALTLRAARNGDGAAVLRFDLPRPGRVSLKLYDLRGRLVAVLAEGEFAAGSHGARWEGRDRSRRVVASGLYFARLATESGNRAISITWVH